MAPVSEQKTEQIIVDLASSDVRSAIIVATSLKPAGEIDPDEPLGGMY